MTTIVRGRVRDGAWVDQEFIYKPPPEVYRTANEHYGTRLLFDRAGHLFYSIGDRGQHAGRAEPREPGRQGAPRDGGRQHAEGQPVRRARGRLPRRSGATATATRRGSRSIPSRASSGSPSTARAAATSSTGSSPGATTAGRSSPTASTTTARRSATRPSGKGMESPVVQWTPSLAVCGIAFYTGDALPGLEERPVPGRTRRPAAAAPRDRGRQGRAPGGPVPKARPCALGRERPRRLPVRGAQQPGPNRPTAPRLARGGAPVVHALAASLSACGNSRGSPRRGAPQLSSPRVRGTFLSMRTTVPPARRERVLDLVHELAHEEDAAAVGLQQVLGRERVGHLGGIEALALVLHLDLERALLAA